MSTLRPGKTSVLVPIVILALLALVVYLDVRWRAAEAKVKQLSVQVGESPDTQQNREKAKQIVDQVRRLMDIPTTPEPTVATIIDVKKLQATNPFYNKAQNGDYLIVTATRAILFSPKTNKILDVVPVQLDETQASSAASKATGAAAKSSTR